MTLRHCLALALALTACTDEGPSGEADILAIGDSLLDFNTPDSDITTVAAEALGMTHEMGAVGGTTLLGDDNAAIPGSYVNGDYRLLIVSGGGNDLGEGCTCGVDCAPILDELISADATSGVVVELVDQAVSDGKQVAWVGYMRPMADAEEFSGCNDELDVLDTRTALLDEGEANMVYIKGSDLGTGQEAELYAEDGYHPSPEGSRVLGEAVAERVSAEWPE